MTEQEIKNIDETLKKARYALMTALGALLPYDVHGKTNPAVITVNDAIEAIDRLGPLTTLRLAR